MMFLPLLAALNSFLTNFLSHAGWYAPIQKYVVPWEARLVAATIMPLGITTKITPDSPLSIMYMVKDGAALPVDLEWNCLGWQSILLLIVSLITGLRGKFTTVSRIKCVLFGLVGTILVNIFRMSFVAAGIYYVNSLFAMIVHDYLAAFVTLCWLIIFWWFSYKYILQEQALLFEKNDQIE